MEEILEELKQDIESCRMSVAGGNNMNIDDALNTLKELKQQLQLHFVMHCFSDVTETKDSIENLVIDYNTIKWLSENGYYNENLELREQIGTSPIFTAVKEAKKRLKDNDNQILMHLLNKRIK